jgi:hypothetical protein
MLRSNTGNLNLDDIRLDNPPPPELSHSRQLESLFTKELDKYRDSLVECRSEMRQMQNAHESVVGTTVSIVFGICVVLVIVFTVIGSVTKNDQFYYYLIIPGALFTLNLMFIGYSRYSNKSPNHNRIVPL